MPKEIDPEVAALIGENRATLPQELVDAGWGQHTMRDYLDIGVELHTPSEVQQPTYHCTCVQCGRPITMSRGRYTDHGGRTRCPSDLMERYSENHLDHIEDHWITVAEAKAREEARHHEREEELARLVKRAEDLLQQKLTGAKAVQGPAPKCSAIKHKIVGHSHVCFHPSGHFGFHECRECRHLWS